MKKLVLLLAVAFSVSMFSCDKKAETTEATTCENAEQCDSVKDATVAPEEVAPEATENKEEAAVDTTKTEAPAETPAAEQK